MKQSVEYLKYVAKYREYRAREAKLQREIDQMRAELAKEHAKFLDKKSFGGK